MVIWKNYRNMVNTHNNHAAWVSIQDAANAKVNRKETTDQ